MRRPTAHVGSASWYWCSSQQKKQGEAIRGGGPGLFGRVRRYRFDRSEASRRSFGDDAAAGGDKDDSAGGSGSSSSAAEGGKVYCRLGTGSAVPTSLAWCPSSSRDVLAIGRKDGAVDLYSVMDESGSYRRIHRILCHPRPVRGLNFTADSALLIVGDDEGTLTVHDVVGGGGRTSNKPTTPIGLVGSVLNAHTSYVLDIAPLSDGKRFVTTGADGVVQVWDVSMLNSGPVHTFADGRGTGMVWAAAASSDGRRLATAHDNGMLVIYSAEE